MGKTFNWFFGLGTLAGIGFLIFKQPPRPVIRYEDVVPPPPPEVLSWSARMKLLLDRLREGLSGTAFKRGEWVYPVPTYRGIKPVINAPFMEPRGGGTFHPGIDFDYFGSDLVGQFIKPWSSPTNDKSIAFMPPDTPALAVSDGEVYAAGLAPPRTYYPWSSSGWYVGIKHANGGLSVYVHLKNNFVQKGEKVVKGQPLGIIANDYGVGGNKVEAVEGGIVHLHFQTYYGGKLVNPMAFLRGAAYLANPEDVRGDYASYFAVSKNTAMPSWGDEEAVAALEFVSG